MRLRTLLLLCLTLLWPLHCAAAPPSALVVTLPDVGRYSVWALSATGTVTVMPRTVMGQKTVPIAFAGGTVCVLDAHTGQVASRTVAPGTRSLSLAFADFKPLAQASAAPPAALPPAPTASAAPPVRDADAPTPANGLAHLGSFVLGLAVAGGVAWLVWRMVQARGEPLLALARRAGVVVPSPAEAYEAPMPTFVPPAMKAPEPVPDAASMPVRAVPSGSGPHLIGMQGLAAGSVFTLDEGALTVGREGSNGIVLAEEGVSRRHATLLRGPSGAVTVRDEGSANGVWVNGERIQEAVLSPGDTVQFGASVFRVAS